MRFHHTIMSLKNELDTLAQVTEGLKPNPLSMTGQNVKQARDGPSSLVAIADLVGLSAASRAHARIWPAFWDGCMSLV
jgi:hypothetical protein